MKTTIRIVDEATFYELYELEFAEFINNIFKMYEGWISGVIRRLITSNALHHYFEDMIQEAKIAIEYSWSKYRFSYGVPFEPYLKKNIVYRLLNFRKMIMNTKNRIMYESIEYTGDYDYFVSEGEDVLNSLEVVELLEELKVCFSKYEYKVLLCLIRFNKLKDIANHLNVPVESLYNTVARIKRKTLKVLSERE